MYFVYIIKSLKDGNYYVGITSNLGKRLNEHNRGKNRSTKGRVPFKLVNYEEFDTLSGARQREKFLKSYKGVQEKRKLMGRGE